MENRRESAPSDNQISVPRGMELSSVLLGQDLSGVQGQLRKRPIGTDLLQVMTDLVVLGKYQFLTRREGGTYAYIGIDASFTQQFDDDVSQRAEIVHPLDEAAFLIERCHSVGFDICCG